jgi:hypothetical protein
MICAAIQPPTPEATAIIRAQPPAIRIQTPTIVKVPLSSMKLSRRDPYRQRRHPVILLGWLVLALFVALLAFSWWMGGEQPVGEIGIDLPSNALGG